jgi:hypothetical protein
MRTLIVSVFAAFVLGACVTPAAIFDAGTPCEASSFTVIDGYAGARRGR